MLGYYARGNLRVAGITPNVIALLPAIIMLPVMFGGGALKGAWSGLGQNTR